MQPGRVDVETPDDATTGAIRLLAKALDVYDTQQQKYSQDRGHEPRPGSAAAKATGHLERMPVTTAIQLDMLARDHLRTMQTILDSGLVPSWSLYSLARVTVETSARSWWILAPDDPDDRTSRAILTQLDMLRARHLLEAGTGNAQIRRASTNSSRRPTRRDSTSPSTTAAHPRRSMDRDSPTTPVSCAPCCPAQARPTTGMPLGEFLYRLLSGATHGNDWMVLTHAEPHGELDDDGYGLVRATGNPAQVAQVVLATVRAHATALDRWCDMCGWSKFSTQPFYKNGVEGRLLTAIADLAS